jgi:hypothetical protein
MKNILNPEVMISWVAATAVAAATMVSFAYSVFETKEISVLRGSAIEKRLDRIEAKIDELKRK